jgi:chromosome segregation ATPase
MNTRIGVIILAVVCAGLGIALFVVKNKAVEQRAKDENTIYDFSNRLVKATGDLDEQRGVNVSLSTDFSNRNAQVLILTNQLVENLNKTSEALVKSSAELKAAQEEIAREVAKVNQLESQNRDLDQKALELGSTITNLNLAIADTQRKLSATEGDKAFLERELQRLMAEKAELERQFTDLEVLRAQVKKLKEELHISKRLEWIRKGIFGMSDMKGGELMMQRNSQGSATPQARQPHYNLNVEVESDGSIRVIPPLTNAPAAPSQ